jgi:LysR family cyn operon transcriptional activator
MSSSIEIRHLRYFLTVALTENFTRAAERLHVSQPNVSQQMKDLETLLGTPLFRRVGNRIGLTDAGVEFRKRAEIVVLKLDEACASVVRVGELMTGHVEVGVIPALHVAWIPPVLEVLARDFPGVRVAVHQRPSRDIETEIEAGRYDLGLGIVSHMSPHVRYERLLTQKLSLVVRADHEFASRKTVATKELERFPLVMLPDNFDMRHMVEDTFRSVKVRPRVAFEIATIDSTLMTVEHARLQTVLPPIVLKGRESLGLRAIELTGGIKPIAFGLLTPRENQPSPAARKFAELVKETVVDARRK